MQRYHHLLILTVSMLLLASAPMASAHDPGKCTAGQERSHEAHEDAATAKAKGQAKSLLAIRDSGAPAHVEEAAEERFWDSVFAIFDAHDHKQDHLARCA